MERREPVLLFIVGAPAVGKMTVAREVDRLTGMPVLHNHMTIDLVLPFFDFGTPPFARLVRLFREELITAVRDSPHPGLCFTYCWAFDAEGDHHFVEHLRTLWLNGGGRVVFAELRASQEVRLHRNATPERLAAKPFKRDVPRSEAQLLELDTRHRFHSDGDFPYPEHLVLETDAMAAEEAARRIVEHFALPTDSRPSGSG